MLKPINRTEAEQAFKAAQAAQQAYYHANTYHREIAYADALQVLGWAAHLKHGYLGPNDGGLPGTLDALIALYAARDEYEVSGHEPEDDDPRGPLFADGEWTERGAIMLARAEAHSWRSGRL